MQLTLTIGVKTNRTDSHLDHKSCIMRATDTKWTRESVISHSFMQDIGRQPLMKQLHGNRGSVLDSSQLQSTVTVISTTTANAEGSKLMIIN